MSALIPIETPDAPAAQGPYSQGILVTPSGFGYISGCIPLVPPEDYVIPGGIIPQTQQALKNFKAILEKAGSTINKVIKTTVYVKDLNDFAKVNEEYAKFFGTHKPARATVEVARLPLDVLIEIEGIVIV
ncbi:translation initiation inhibitor [Paxillus ammoniavirescens]|nr:translation initiation inhibitor [Paxillus ammoniavirescens]